LAYDDKKCLCPVLRNLVYFKKIRKCTLEYTEIPKLQIQISFVLAWSRGFWTSYYRCQVLKTARSRANILIHILYKKLVGKTKTFLRYVSFANKIICLQLDLNKEPLHQIATEQKWIPISWD
jgi:hypothetical protein